MQIIIIGAGTVGSNICTQLAKEGHNITVVDRGADNLTELSNVCDVAGVVGNGASVPVLRKAGAERADLLIAVTSSDEINTMCCVAANKLGTRHTIARVRNPEYTELTQLMQGEMNLSLTINPELAVAREIYRILRYPSATKIDTFAGGRVELAEIVVREGSPVCGLSLTELRARFNIPFLVCAVKRGDRVYIPSGSFRMEKNDTICVTAPDDKIVALFKAIGVWREPVRNVIIAGGGRVTYYLEELISRGHISSTVIERDKNVCVALAESFRATVVCDNPTKQERLLEQGIEHADAFLALSPVDGENAIMSVFAKTHGVKNVVTMINSMSYIDFFRSVGLESVVSSESTTSAVILRYVRSMNTSHDSEIETLHHIMDGAVEALEFLVKQKIDGITGVPLRELKPREGVLVACILHDGEVKLPSGNDTIECGDNVIVITTGGRMKSIRDIR